MNPIAEWFSNDLEIGSIPVQEQKSYDVNLSQGASDFIKYGYTNAHSAQAAMGLYDQSSFVSIPINKISKPFSCIEPVLFNIKEGKVIRDHPLLDLMRNPSPGFSQQLFLKTMANHYLITGETTMVASGNPTRPPLELSPISPSDVSPVEGGNGLPSIYQVGGLFFNDVYSQQVIERQLRFFDRDNVREFKMIRDYATDRGSRIRGQSLLKSASRDIRQAILGTEHNVSILEKGGRMSLHFAFEEDMDEDDFRETKLRTKQQYGGAARAGTVGVSAGSKLQIIQAGATNQEMDFANLHEMIKQTLALVYGVPLPLVSLSASTMNNYEVAILALYDDGVLPLAKVLLGGLAEFLFPRYGMDMGEWRLTVDQEQITTLKMRTLGEIEIRKKIGIESRNELRGILGREDTEGGDILYVQSSMVPDGSDVFDEDADLFDLTETTPDPIEEVDDDDAESLGDPSALLNGAQVTSMIGLVTSVGSGDLSKQSAVLIMSKAFGMSMNEASDIIGDPPEPTKPLPPAPLFGGDE
ncbi:hypothetical protein LCGC14_0615990 [marine sediment metagenome]|uniref:Portal protein n=1 Tax=marine sediment metagenome TaxID=412755 RepID=A0A0F9R6B0_9ZZZZ